MRIRSPELVANFATLYFLFWTSFLVETIPAVTEIFIEIKVYIFFLVQLYIKYLIIQKAINSSVYVFIF